ncbi:hypothetical protein [Pseudomonas syringae]|uniref:hypothetical protein n=1 Tax=Pseudomonas syringae TaxID=317 RepID=UPI0004630126|nr:hypothetical protein [Pseudomonas syringae]QGG78929.1 hypothetical protein N028_26755 [Pseudomonas syringae USA011]
MKEKTPDELAAELRKSIESVEKPLTAIALLGLIDEFYSKEDRSALYREYEVLSKASKNAYEKLMSTKATVEPGIGWDERERKYGKEVATEHMRPHMEALEEKKAVDLKLAEFQREHPLLIRIQRAKTYIGKSDYE